MRRTTWVVSANSQFANVLLVWSVSHAHMSHQSTDVDDLCVRQTDTRRFFTQPSAFGHSVDPTAPYLAGQIPVKNNFGVQ